MHDYSGNSTVCFVVLHTNVTNPIIRLGQSEHCHLVHLSNIKDTSQPRLLALVFLLGLKKIIKKSPWPAIRNHEAGATEMPPYLKYLFSDMLLTSTRV